MKKRKGSLLQRMMAVLLAAVLVIGMVSNAAPVTVLAQEPDGQQESVSGNDVETPEGDIPPEEETETNPEEAEEITADEAGQDVQALLARIAALPDAEEYLAAEPDADDWAENEDAYEEAYTEWMAGLYGYADEALAVQEEVEKLTEEQRAQISEEELQKLAAWAEIAPTAGESAQMMMAAEPAPQANNIASGDGWVLDADGKLTISSGEGMAGWENYMRGDYEYYTRQVVNVEIQDGVTSLGNNAFYNYGELTGITIADSVTSIAGSAFCGCWKLRKITIPNNVTSISDRMFMNSGLEEITILGSVTSIGEFAFWGCGLTKITIPDSVKSIGEKAFIYCDNLNEVIIKSETPPTLGDGVFTDCGFIKDNTQSIHVPEGKAQAYKTAWTDWAAYIADGTHTHSWLSDWTSNETHHWHECTVSDCPITGNADKDGYGAHIYDNDSDTDCNTCGYERTAAATEIVGIEVDCDLTSARAAQIGDNLVRPGASVTLNPETASQAAPSWLKKEDSGFTEYKGNTWEEGTYVRKVEVTIYEGYIFAAEPKITSSTGENWTVVERSDDNRTIVLRSDEIVKTARPHTHDLTLTPAKDATCTEDGNTAYYVCGGNGGCGKWFSDAEGTQEITNHDSVVISKTGHSYDESAWGYTGADGHAHKCLNCNEHDTVQAHTPGAAATETTPQTCTVCGYELSPTIGHTHNYGDWQHDSTQHWKVCSCGDETGRGNHDYGDWITDREATATEAGAKHRDCQTCAYRETGTIPATGTDSGSGTVTPEVKPGENTPETNASAPAEELTVSGSADGIRPENPAPSKPYDPATAETRVKSKQQGNIYKEVSIKAEDTFDAVIATQIPELANIVLTEAEKQQAAGGTNIKIILEVQDAQNIISSEDKALVEAALNSPGLKGFAVGQYLDISLFKIIGESRDAIHESYGKITITIAVPDSLKNTDNNKTRVFAVIRVHGGQAELLADLDSDEDTITIETDRFSPYAIVYKDMQGGTKNSGTKDKEPKTGDAEPVELFATLSMVAGVSYLLLYFTERGHGMSEETKKEFVSRLVRWAKRGGKIRKLIALLAIFALLVYYHSIGKNVGSEKWENEELEICGLKRGL